MEEIKIFAKLVSEAVSNKVRGKVIIKKVVNPNMSYVGLSINTDDVPVSPVINLDSYYNLYNNGISIDEIACRIVNAWKDNSRNTELKTYSELTGNIGNFDKIKHMIMPCVINGKMNHDLLMDVPYREMLDLAVTYRISLNENASILIRNEILESWGVTEETLYKQAKENIKKVPKTFISPLDMFPEMSADVSEEDVFKILSIEDYYYGASVILDEDIMYELCKKMGSFIIIPSSLEEVLIMPETKPVGFVNKIIQSINSSELSVNQYLSDHAYGVVLEEGNIKIVSFN